jgi:hypothetical protein
MRLATIVQQADIIYNRNGYNKVIAGLKAFGKGIERLSRYVQDSSQRVAISKRDK